MEKQNKIKYFAYVRKSTEGLERQALSIPAQKDKITELFSDYDIEFVEDRASAFKPFNRPNFAKMIERIEKGERTGLIAWHPDRLSRNETDAGTITYMTRNNVIKDLKIVTFQFENTPEGIWMLQSALSQSQYESAKKGRDVKRGLIQSAKMGFFPCPAPLGYLDDKFSERGKKKKLKDPERFDLVRKMFDLMLTGKYNTYQIQRIVNEEWGFRGPHGKKMSRSAMYVLFIRPFYYGEFEYPLGSGIFYQGSHQAMITKAEYDRIQILIGRKSTPRVKQHNIIYRGPMKCGECGAMITAEEKVKYQKNGNIHYYTYYHCTKRMFKSCSQKCIEEKELEKQISEELKKIEIPEDFKKWALLQLKSMNSQEVDDREKIFGSQRREYDACVRKIDNLIDMRANDELTEDEYRTRKQALLIEKTKLQDLLKDTDNRVENWLEIAERGFNFAERASAIFEETKDIEFNYDSLLETKKDIFVSLGSDLILKDKILSIYWDELLFPMKEMRLKIKEIKEGLEPVNEQATQRDFGVLYSQSSRLLCTPV